MPDFSLAFFFVSSNIEKQRRSKTALRTLSGDFCPFDPSRGIFSLSSFEAADSHNIRFPFYRHFCVRVWCGRWSAKVGQTVFKLQATSPDSVSVAYMLIWPN